MTLGDDVAAALAELRAAAESRMSETVTVGLFRDGTDANGNATRVLVTSRYSGKGRIRYASRVVMNAGSGSSGAAYTVQEPTLSLPVGSPRCFDGDEVDVTGTTDDGVLVGRRFKIQGSLVAGQTTAHRYLLQELG